MSDELVQEIEAFLKNDREDRDGLEYLQRLGADGVRRLLQQMEIDYTHAAAVVELSGRDVARITVLAHALARAAGITSQDGKETMARLVEVGWVMARWYGRD